jgi:hypothetical protein
MEVRTARKRKRESPELLLGGNRLKVFWLQETPRGSSSFILFPGGLEGHGGMAGFGERERARERKKNAKRGSPAARLKE